MLWLTSVKWGCRLHNGKKLAVGQPNSRLKKSLHYSLVQTSLGTLPRLGTQPRYEIPSVLWVKYVKMLWLTLFEWGCLLDNGQPKVWPWVNQIAVKTFLRYSCTEFQVEVDNKLEVYVEFAVICDACSVTTLAEKSTFWRFTVQYVGGKSYGCSG